MSSSDSFFQFTLVWRPRFPPPRPLQRDVIRDVIRDILHASFLDFSACGQSETIPEGGLRRDFRPSGFCRHRTTVVVFVFHAGTKSVLDCLSSSLSWSLFLSFIYCALTVLLTCGRPRARPSDVTFAVAGRDGDGRGGGLAGQAGLGARRVPEAVRRPVVIRQRPHRPPGEDLLLEPGHNNHGH